MGGGGGGRKDFRGREKGKPRRNDVNLSGVKGGVRDLGGFVYGVANACFRGVPKPPFPRASLPWSHHPESQDFRALLSKGF